MAPLKCASLGQAERPMYVFSRTPLGMPPRLVALDDAVNAPSIYNVIAPFVL